RFLSIAPAPPQIYTLSLHDALPISSAGSRSRKRTNIPERNSMSIDLDNATFLGYRRENGRVGVRNHVIILPVDDLSNAACEAVRSEEHTSELQSRENLVCRLLLEKK